jgi:hypothetical protein
VLIIQLVCPTYTISAAESKSSVEIFSTTFDANTETTKAEDIFSTTPEISTEEAISTTTAEFSTSEELAAKPSAGSTRAENVASSTTVQSSTTTEFLSTATEGFTMAERGASSTTVRSSTTIEIVATSIKGSKKTEEAVINMSVESTSADDAASTTTAESTTTTEAVSTTKKGSSTTQEAVFTTKMQSSTSNVFVFTTTVESPAAEEAVMKTRTESTSTEEGAPTTTNPGSTIVDGNVNLVSTSVAKEQTTISMSTMETISMSTENVDLKMADDVAATTTSNGIDFTLTAGSTETNENLASPVDLSTTTETLSLHPQLQSNAPGITVESISGLTDEIQEGCFEGIEDLCQPNATNGTSCQNSIISDLLVVQVVSIASDSLVITLPFTEAGFYTSATHNSTCEGNQEIDWIETFEITSTVSREPNTTYQVTAILRTQTFTSMSFLQVGINSFGTSSIQSACFILNGDIKEFSSIVGGIVAGYTISESQYDCTRFVSVPLVSTPAGNYTSSASLTTENEFYDLSDAVGLSLEYAIVCIYIVFSYIAAFKAYQLHQKQRTRTDFKTNVNRSFVILFLVWGSGNLLYLILLSVALTDTNFFYIKSVLTLTYFASYFGFYLIVHYRYRLTFSLF